MMGKEGTVLLNEELIIISDWLGAWDERDGGVKTGVLDLGGGKRVVTLNIRVDLSELQVMK